MQQAEAMVCFETNQFGAYTLPARLFNEPNANYWTECANINNALGWQLYQLNTSNAQLRGQPVPAEPQWWKVDPARLAAFLSAGWQADPAAYGLPGGVGGAFIPK